MPKSPPARAQYVPFLLCALVTSAAVALVVGRLWATIVWPMPWVTGVDICADGLDNDNDDAIDGADANCDGRNADAISSDPWYMDADICLDGLDNDGDDAVDDMDPDCDGMFPSAIPEDPVSTDIYELICDDRLDNDSDQMVDAADPDCVVSSDATVEQLDICADGLDNDDDGLFDAEDVDCDYGWYIQDGVSASSVSGVEICNDGVDNDGDEMIDAADPDCNAMNAGASSSIVSAPAPSESEPSESAPFSFFFDWFSSPLLLPAFLN